MGILRFLFRAAVWSIVDVDKPNPSRRKYQKPQNFRHDQVLHLPVVPQSGELSGRCYVIDGDTIIIAHTKIRLAGIDAPELNHPWGQKAKWTMVDICKGQIVTAKLNGERSHDRLVATCFLPDGQDIGAELVKRGLALDWPQFSNGKYRHLEPQGVRQKLFRSRLRM